MHSVLSEVLSDFFHDRLTLVQAPCLQCSGDTVVTVGALDRGRDVIRQDLNQLFDLGTISGHGHCLVSKANT